MYVVTSSKPLEPLDKGRLYNAGFKSIFAIPYGLQSQYSFG